LNAVAERDSAKKPQTKENRSSKNFRKAAGLHGTAPAVFFFMLM
jgi:hypothetical protein